MGWNVAERGWTVGVGVQGEMKCRVGLQASGGYGCDMVEGGWSVKFYRCVDLGMVLGVVVC